MKILSIVVPVYNTEKYIRRCIDSLLLKEIIDDIEIILVNDGSKDNSINIMNEYKKKYPKSIVVIDKENGGHGSTINEGLKVASGKYFRVIDSDDWVNAKDFIAFVKSLANIDTDLVITNYCKEHIYSGVSEYLEYKKLENNKIYDFDTFDLNILKGEYFVMATSTYKTDIIRKSGLQMLEKTFYVDMQFNIVPILMVKNFIFLDLDIYRYFIGRKDQSMNLNVFVKNKLHHEKVLRALIDVYSEYSSKISNNKKEYLKMIIKYMLNTHYTIFCVYDKDRKNAYKQIKKFDNFLRIKNIELYNCISDIKYIQINRKTKFVITRINGNVINKLIVFCKKIIRR